MKLKIEYLGVDALTPYENNAMDVTSKRYLHATKAMEDDSVEKMNRMFAANE